MVPPAGDVRMNATGEGILIEGVHGPGVEGAVVIEERIRS